MNSTPHWRTHSVCEYENFIIVNGLLKDKTIGHWTDVFLSYFAILNAQHFPGDLSDSADQTARPKKVEFIGCKFLHSKNCAGETEMF